MYTLKQNEMMQNMVDVVEHGTHRIVAEYHKDDIQIASEVVRCLNGEIKPIK